MGGRPIPAVTGDLGTSRGRPGMEGTAPAQSRAIHPGKERNSFRQSDREHRLGKVIWREIKLLIGIESRVRALFSGLRHSIGYHIHWAR